MQIEQIATAELIPYARNSRTHSAEQVAQIAASIREFGFTNPVLIDAENGIIAGHGRILAANQIDMPTVLCIRLSHLTESQKRAYIIADNKLALNAGWDEAMLQLEIADLQALEFDLDLLGFSHDEIHGISEEIVTQSADEIMKLTQETDKNISQEKISESEFLEEMKQSDSDGKLKIVPMYAEHHQAFVIVCDNMIDEAWIRNRLKLEFPHGSYKDTKIQSANVLTVKQFREALQ